VYRFLLGGAKVREASRREGRRDISKANGAAGQV